MRTDAQHAPDVQARARGDICNNIMKAKLNKQKNNNKRQKQNHLPNFVFLKSISRARPPRDPRAPGAVFTSSASVSEPPSPPTDSPFRMVSAPNKHLTQKKTTNPHGEVRRKTRRSPFFPSFAFVFCSTSACYKTTGHPGRGASRAPAVVGCCARGRDVLAGCFAELSLVTPPLSSPPPLPLSSYPGS